MWLEIYFVLCYYGIMNNFIDNDACIAGVIFIVIAILCFLFNDKIQEIWDKKFIQSDKGMVCGVAPLLIIIPYFLPFFFCGIGTMIIMRNIK